jgi:hypothetical protein
MLAVDGQNNVNKKLNIKGVLSSFVSTHRIYKISQFRQGTCVAIGYRRPHTIRYLAALVSSVLEKGRDNNNEIKEKKCLYYKGLAPRTERCSIARR